MNLRWKIAQAAELKWWHWYLRNKDTDSYLQWKLNYWKNMLTELQLALQPGERVLDAGCGPAGIFMALTAQQVTAVDPLLDSYAAEIPHFDPDVYPYVHFENCALENYQSDQLFDTVFCINAINHVADIQKAIEQLLLSCKPGGRLVISIDAHNYHSLKKIFRMLPGDILHPHQHDLEDYKKMLKQAGAVIQRELRFKKGFIFDYYVLVAQRDTDTIF